jgi:hypothetical protein
MRPDRKAAHAARRAHARCRAAASAARMAFSAAGGPAASLLISWDNDAARPYAGDSRG